MNQQEAHLLTLWCAVLSKAGKGFSRLVPPEFSLVGGRVMGQLERPETPALSGPKLAHALVIRPSEVAVATASLRDKGLIEPVPASEEDPLFAAGSESESDPASATGSASVAASASDAEPRWQLTPEGRQLIQMLDVSLNRFNSISWSELKPAEFNLLMDMVYDAVVRPGSFFAEITTRDYRSFRVPDHYYVTCIFMLSTLVDSAAKRAMGLSMTDFRFLLELYPKRRDAEKMLRAKELAGRLAVGRAYISTSSSRLEERGYVKRVPDPQDMRGVLFQLTPQGMVTVSQMGEDLMVAFDSLFRPRREQYVDMINMLRALLKGTDAALFAKDFS